MHTVSLGCSDLAVIPICLGTTTFGEQLDPPATHTILDDSLDQGVNVIDTAEMYLVPFKAQTLGATQTISRSTGSIARRRRSTRSDGQCLNRPHEG